MNNLIVFPVALLALNLFHCLFDYLAEVPRFFRPCSSYLPYIFQNENFDGLRACHAQQQVIEVVKFVLIIPVSYEGSVEYRYVRVDELEDENFEDEGLLEGIEELMVLKVYIVGSRVGVNIVEDFNKDSIHETDENVDCTWVL